MPDDELFRLAAEHKLRDEPAGPGRSGCSPTRGRASSSATSSASGSRPATSTRSLINARAVISRDEPPDPKAEERRARFRELNRKPPESLTEAEKKELEAVRGSFFGGVPPLPRVRADRRPAPGHAAARPRCSSSTSCANDRSLLELLDSDYTFLNERLAKHYGIDGVTGDEMRLGEAARRTARAAAS